MVRAECRSTAERVVGAVYDVLGTQGDRDERGELKLRRNVSVIVYHWNKERLSERNKR